jgi:hypothetical protein
MRLIDADALLKKKTYLWDEVLGTEACVCVDDIEAAPAVDAVPVVHGRWIPFKSEAAGNIQYCSACGIGNPNKTNYCPKCGAKMDGGNDG